MPALEPGVEHPVKNDEVRNFAVAKGLIYADQMITPHAVDDYRVKAGGVLAQPWNESTRIPLICTAVPQGVDRNIPCVRPVIFPVQAHDLRLVARARSMRKKTSSLDWAGTRRIYRG